MNELDIEKVETNIDKWVSAGFLTEEEWEKYKDEYRVEIEQKIAASLPWTFTQTDYTNGLIEWTNAWDMGIIKETVEKAIEAGLITPEKWEIVLNGYEYKINRNKAFWETEVYDENGEKINTSSDTEKVLEVMAPIIQEVYQDPNMYISQLSEKQQVQFQAIRTKLQEALSGKFLEKLNSYSQEKKESTINAVLQKAENLKNTNSSIYMKAIYEEVIIQIWELK